MGELITLVFGASSALQCSTKLLSLAVQQDASDALLTNNKVARAVVYSKSPIPPAAFSQEQAHEASIGEDLSYDSTWTGNVHRVDREHIAPRRLQERFWHPYRSLAYSDRETFVDNFRYFLESCDVFSGVQCLVDEDELNSASALLCEIGDDVVGSQGFRRKSMVTPLFTGHSFVSPAAAVSLASLGPMVTSYVPVLSFGNDSANDIATALNVITFPHRCESDRLELFVNLRSVTGVPGDLPVSRLELTSANLDRTFGLSPATPKICWGRLKVVSTANASDSSIKDDWHSLVQSATRHVSIKPSAPILTASLTVDATCSKWIGGLHTVFKSRVGIDYSRLTSMESDDREEMLEVLLQSHHALHEALN